MSKRRLKVGIVGCGNISDRHVQNYRRLPDVELVAICDIDEQWLKHRQAMWSVPQAYVSYEEMFTKSDVEAVSITLPAYLHGPATIAALQAGKHVLVEKPMAMTAEQAQQMADAAKASGRLLTVGHNQRFDPDIEYLKRCMEERQFGDIYFVRTLWRRPMGVAIPPIVNRATGQYCRNWINEVDKGGGAARDLGSHVIDLAMWLMGFPEVDQVIGGAYCVFGANKYPPEWVDEGTFRNDADEHSVGFVRFANGASMQVEASRAQHTEKEVIITELFGDKGGAFRSIGAPLKLFTNVSGMQSTIEPRLPKPTRFPESDFTECVLTGKAPRVMPEQVVTVMRIIDAIRNCGPAKS